MTHITRRTAVKGLVGAGLAPLINTSCIPESPCSAGFFFVAWFWFGLTKAIMLASRKEQDTCFAYEPIKPNDEALKAIEAMGSKSARAEPRITTKVPHDGTLRLEDATVTAAVIPSRDRVWVLDTYGNSRIRILAANPMRQIAALPIEGGPRAIVLSPDRSTVYVARNPLPQGASILAIDTRTNAITMPFTDFPPDAFPSTLAISPDGSRLLVCADKSSGASALYVVSVPEKRTLRTIDLAGGSVSEMVFTPDSQLCFCLRKDRNGVGDVWAFDALAMEFTVKVDQYALLPKLAMSPAGDRLYISDARVEPFDAATRLTGLAAVDTSSLRVAGYIPYTDSLDLSKSRRITGLYPHPTGNALFASFLNETGYTVFDLSSRKVEGPFVPDVPDTLEYLYVMALASF